MNSPNQATPQVASIDNVSYLVSDLTQEAINLMQIMDVTSKKLQEVQIQVAINTAAYDQFGVALREQLKNISPINANTNTPAVAKKAPRRSK